MARRCCARTVSIRIPSGIPFHRSICSWIRPRPALGNSRISSSPRRSRTKSYYLSGVHIQPPGHGAFGSSSGGYSFGGKVTVLSEDGGHPFGLGVRGYMEIPSEHPSYNTTDWRNVAGVSGRPDIGADVLFAKAVRRTRILANVGYERVGDPTRGLRVRAASSTPPGGTRSIRRPAARRAFSSAPRWSRSWICAIR